MAALSTTPEPIKMLLLGMSGSGKTGMLASLAVAGYNLRILDYDNGTEILGQVLKNNPAAIARVDVEKCLDVFEQGQDKSIKWKADKKGDMAYPKGLATLDNWPGLGSAKSFGPNDIVVLDSLTFLGEAIMRYVLSMNGKNGTTWDPKAGPTEPNWGSAIGLQEDFLALLTSNLKCHLIVTAHLKTVKQGGIDVPVPSALGQKLPPNVATYFNHALKAESKGGARKLLTTTQGLLELKSAAPKSVKPEYSLETGMADYFKDCGFGPLK
jgi:hypothetical protein